MLNNMGEILAEMQRLQQELKNMTIEVSEGGDAFRVVMNGYQEVQGVYFNPSVLSPANVEELQAMVAGAFNRAIEESKQMLKNEIGRLTGGLNLPNISGLF
ncbi:MAG: YbaB/EbfC family nucleoid-associated protein [Peptococcaceae bacterium]|nr:YbaB/EbfC family nucleoid-associated protein [Peptococcaceae bacterium]